MNHDDFHVAEPEAIDTWSRDLLVGVLIAMCVLSLIAAVLGLITS